MFGTDDYGWYTGTVPDGTPGAVAEAPPISSTSTEAGVVRARWVRYAWRVEEYAPVPVLPPPVAYGMDADGWYTGTVEPGTAGSTSNTPPISSTSATPGEPRARWVGGWVVQAYPAPEPVLPHITRLAFLTRFSDAEAIAIDLASQGATPQAAAMRRYQAKVAAALYIDLSRDDTRAGVQALEAAGLLATGRAAEILDAPIQSHERPL